MKEDDGGGGGGGTPLGTPPERWQDSLPEDLRDNPSIKDYKDMNSLVKAYIHQQKLIGTDKIPAPNDKWGQEDWDKFYSTLGRPESPDKYEIEMPELPEGVQIPEKHLEWLKEDLHASGMTQRQAEEFIKRNLGRLSEEMESRQKEQETRLLEFQKAKGDEYKKIERAAQMFVQEFGSPEIIEFFDKSGLGNSPELIELLGKAGSALMEDGGRGSGGRGFQGSTDPESELRALMADEKFKVALYDGGNPDHEWAVNKRLELLKQINPGTTKFV